MTSPLSIDADDLGNVWVIDNAFDAIYRIDSNDQLTVVSGRGSGPPAEGAAAADVRFRSAFRIAADGSGGAALAVSTNEIWRISPSGTVSKMAGTGERPAATTDQGDDGPAVRAAIDVEALEFSPDGDLYFASAGVARDIRRIDGNGVIRHIAGGHPPDGVLPATAHRFGAVSLDVDEDGQIYLAEAVANLNFLRQLPPEGVPPDTAALAFSVADLIGAEDDLSRTDSVLDHTLEFLVTGDVADVALTEGSCGRGDPDAATWDTITGNDTPGLGVALNSRSLQNDASGDLPTLELAEPTLLTFYFQDAGAVLPAGRVCLTLVDGNGREDETTLVIRGFDED